MIDNEMSEKPTGLQLTRQALERTRRKALRHRCWFKVLSRLERGIIELTIRCVEEVKSIGLRSTLTKILIRLVQAFGPGYLNIAESMGRPLAGRISRLAQSWGNALAAEWEDDTTFIRYLGVNALSPEICLFTGFGT